MLCKNKYRKFITNYSKSITTLHAKGQISGSAEQVVSENSVLNTGNK